MRFQPLLPLRSDNASDVAKAKCNEIFASNMRIGNLESPLKPNTAERIDFWLRLLDILSEGNIDSLEPYIQDINYQINKPLEEYQSSILPKDRLDINSLISIFELISHKRDKILDPRRRAPRSTSPPLHDSSRFRLFVRRGAEASSGTTTLAAVEADSAQIHFGNHGRPSRLSAGAALKC